MHTYQCIIKKIFLSLFFISLMTAAYGQRSVSGTITDAADGTPLPGVNVSVKGTVRGTISDISGHYELALQENDETLVFSYVGYETEELGIGSRSRIDMALKLETKSLDEIVVIGYGTIKKKDLTGSVSTVKPEDVQGMPVARADLLLQGRAAGVEITQNSGAPGGAIRMRIRGVNSISSGNDPLIVIDGFPGGQLEDINPNDIERIDILKDASALAIYGARASNGVVLVTTKSGNPGKDKFEFTYSKSIQNISQKIDVLNSQEYGYMINETYHNDGDKRPYPVIGSRRFPTKPEEIDWDVDWHDLVYRQGETDEYQLSFSGGNEKMRYYLSGNLYDQKGIVPSSEFKRYSARMNIDAKVNKWLKVSLNTNASRKAYLGETGFWDGIGVSNNILGYSPLFEPRDTLGVWQYDKLSIPADNPLSVVTIPVPVSELQLDDLLSDFSAELTILPSLHFKTSAGIATTYRRHGQANLQESIVGSSKVSPAGNSGEAWYNNYQIFRFVNENILTFDKTFNPNHHVLALLGYTWEKESREDYNGRGYGFVSDAFMFNYLNIGAADVYSSMSSGKSTRQFESYLGRIHYDLTDRYSITLNGRVDGSSVFAVNKKYGFFPSGAVAWKIHNESFMSNVNFISELKARASYGMVGNAEIGSYKSLARLAITNGVLNNNQRIGVVVPLTVSNSELGWESTKQMDIGLDIGLFNNRITMTADYYDKLTYDLLLDKKFPGTSGFAQGTVNVGEVSNKGFEFSIHTFNISAPFKWETDFNISTNKNLILDLADNDTIVPSNATLSTALSQDMMYMIKGEPLSSFVGLHYVGVYQDKEEADANGGSLGGPKYADTDSNGKFEETKDRVLIGSAFPDFVWGMNNTFSYKGWSLGIFIQASMGGDIYNLTRQRLETMNPSTNLSKEAWDKRSYYDAESEQWVFTDVPKVSAYNKMLPTDRFIEDGTYIRLQNVTLGYSLPRKWLDIIHIAEFKVYVSGQNLYLWTNYKGYDPEVSRYKNSDIFHGVDDGNYPSVRGFTFGLKIGF